MQSPRPARWVVAVKAGLVSHRLSIEEIVGIFKSQLIRNSMKVQMAS